MKRRQRTVYWVTIAAMLALIGGYALAATTVTTLAPQQSSNVTQSPTPGGFSSIATVSSEQLVVLSAGMTGSGSTGIETGGAVGLSGSTTQLANCPVAPCAIQNFKTAFPATEVTGNYGEQIVVNAFQSVTNSAIGFDMAITVSITVGITTSSVTALGYLELPTLGPTETISVFLFVDLGTTSAPVINSVSVIFNQCAVGTACP